MKKRENKKNNKSPIVIKKVTTKNRVQGKLKQIKGAAKVKLGKLTGQNLSVINGDIEKVEGYIQEKFGVNLKIVRKKLQNFLKTRAKTFKKKSK